MNLTNLENKNIEKKHMIIAAGIEEFSRKSYYDASTDAIVQGCKISKGLLFHYFGSKKEFYLYCLSISLERLMEPTAVPEGKFYDILFGIMNQKLQVCAKYPRETKFVNMASRETSSDVAKGKEDIFAKYASQTHAASSVIMKQALATLSLKEEQLKKAKEGLLLYTNAVMGKYLGAYQNNPADFFNNVEYIQLEIKEYIDLMLCGIVKEDNV